MKKIKLFLQNSWKRVVFAFSFCVKDPDLYPVGRFNNICLDDLVEYYIQHMKTAKFFADQIGAEYYNFLQPFSMEGRKKYTHFEIQANAHILRKLSKNGDKESDLIREFYNKLWDKVRGEGYVFDLRNIFADMEGDVYFDQVHLSDIGSDIVAKKIVDCIMKKKKEKPTNPDLEEIGFKR